MFEKSHKTGIYCSGQIHSEEKHLKIKNVQVINKYNYEKKKPDGEKKIVCIP